MTNFKISKNGKFSFRPLSRGLFFNGNIERAISVSKLVFVPSLGDFFSINASRFPCVYSQWTVFVPSLGDFFSIACLRSPSPSALASAFAAGMGESLHQALSFGDEMPIFPVRAGIGGDGNEKWCCLIPSYSSLLSNFRVQGSGFRVQGCGGGFAASIYGAMPESSIQVTSH